jgi:3alpha(or 20beta)-hydroxysteroid dehydrogenase/cyclopentanol dehydrogenase
MNHRLNGKIALVTGAGRGGNIGLAIVRAFLREGAAGVVATDNRLVEEAALTAGIEAEFGTGRFVLLKHDVTSPDSWAEVYAQTLQRFGALDVLVNNAGVSKHGGVEHGDLETVRWAMAVNHDALFIGMKTCLPALLDAVNRHPGGGSIINNLSMASYMPNAHNIAYHSSKAAGRMLTICAAKEFGPRKIRVNSVHLGMTITPLIFEALEEYKAIGLWDTNEAALAALAAEAPLNMTSAPEDAAHAFVYLASEEARFVTGASIEHDGGIGLKY